MAQVGFARRVAPVFPIRPAVPYIRINARIPNNYRPPVINKPRPPVPRQLSVLQAPIPVNEEDFYEEEQELESDEMFNYPTVVLADQNKTRIPHIPFRVPTFVSQKNYRIQQSTRLFRQHRGYPIPAYPSRFYYNR